MQNNQVQRQRRRYRRRPWYNRNHKIKSRNGVIRLAGFRRKRVHRRRRMNPGHNNTRRRVHLDPQLAAFMGRQLATRGEIVSRVWQYARDNHLQNPENGRFFRPDQRLATLLGREGEYINGFTILGHLKNHYRQN
jgi:chromatin remodeling complex protein RSC6